MNTELETAKGGLVLDVLCKCGMKIHSSEHIQAVIENSGQGTGKVQHRTEVKLQIPELCLQILTLQVWCQAYEYAFLPAPR